MAGNCWFPIFDSETVNNKSVQNAQKSVKISTTNSYIEFNISAAIDMLYSLAIFSAKGDPEPNLIENVDNTVGYSRMALAFSKSSIHRQDFQICNFWCFGNKKQNSV